MSLDARQMALLRPYQSIIGMGMPVVPLILEELERELNNRPQRSA